MRLIKGFISLVLLSLILSCTSTKEAGANEAEIPSDTAVLNMILRFGLLFLMCAIVLMMIRF